MKSTGFHLADKLGRQLRVRAAIDDGTQACEGESDLRAWNDAMGEISQRILMHPDDRYDVYCTRTVAAARSLALATAVDLPGNMPEVVGVLRVRRAGTQGQLLALNLAHKLFPLVPEVTTSVPAMPSDRARCHLPHD